MLVKAANEPEPMPSGAGVAAVVVLLLGLKLPFRAMLIDSSVLKVLHATDATGR
jgi:hypothetical protein